MKKLGETEIQLVKQFSTDVSVLSPPPPALKGLYSLWYTGGTASLRRWGLVWEAVPCGKGTPLPLLFAEIVINPVDSFADNVGSRGVQLFSAHFQLPFGIVVYQHKDSVLQRFVAG